MRVARWSILLIVGVAWAAGAVHAAPADNGAAAYLDGLDALEAAQFNDAIDAFSKALDADEDNGRFLLARGVARVFSEKFKDADRDLLRAAKLLGRGRGDDDEVRMWQATVVQMQGDFTKAPGIYPEATRIEAFNDVRTMSRQYGRINFVRQSQRDSEPDFVRAAEAEQQAARQKFPELAAAFAARAKASTPGVGSVLIVRAKQRLDRRDYPGAYADVSRLLAGHPDDATTLLYAAICNAHLGAPQLARRQYTKVLTQQPDDPNAWAGRAVVAAMLGDGDRAAADLKIAASIDPAAAKAVADEVRVPQSTAANLTPKRDELPALVEALQKSLKRGGMPESDVTAQAAAIVRGANAQRRYADETYVERRRELIAATRAIPTTATSLANLGEFLFRQASMARGEAVEPRAEFQTYRPQTKDSQTQEMQQAEQALDAAIKTDPRNVQALTFKGACLAWRLEYGKAEAVLTQALAIDATYAPLLDVFSQLLDHAAGVKAAAASDLRSTKSWTTLDYIYWRYPSQSELNQAAEYEAQAQRLWALAEQHLQAAVKLHAGKRDGFYYEAVIARRHGDPQAARASLEKCVQVSPDDVQALDQLSTVYGQLGLQREAFATQARATNLSHTTAGPMLRYAWTQIGRTAWKASRDACRAAIALDPADPRAPAYLGAIAEADGQAEESTAWYRVAAAIEQARGMLNASTFDPNATGTLSPDACGFLIALDVRLGRQALEAKHNEEALTAFRQCVAMTDRVERIDRFRKIASSMLPSGSIEEKANAPLLPEAQSIFDLAAWARLGVGDAYRALGKRDEAIAAYRPNVDLEQQKPPTIDAGNGFREPEAWSVMHLTRLLMDKKDIAAAFALTNRGLPWGLTKEANDEWRKLSDEVRQARNRQESAGQPDSRREFDRRQQEDLQQIQQQQRDADRKRQEELQKIRQQQQDADRKRRQQQK